MSEELRLHRCCFTGHRPDKTELGEKEIKPLLEKAIDEAIAEGYVTFITGMAMGTDIWAAEIVLERKERNKDLHLICALPHPGFDSRRSMTEKMRFNKIIKNADLVKEINHPFISHLIAAGKIMIIDFFYKVSIFHYLIKPHLFCHTPPALKIRVWQGTYKM